MFRTLKTLPFGLALALGGCYSFDGRVDDEVQVSAIIDKIECELKDAYKKHVGAQPVLARWSASFTLDLQRDTAAGVGPKLGYSVPTSTGAFQLDAGAGVSGKKARTLNFTRTIKALGALSTYECKDAPRTGVFTGSLGIEEAFADFLGGADKGDKVGPPEEVGYTIEFDVKYSAGVTPTFIFTRITGLGAEFSASVEKRNKLTFAFADNPPPDNSPLRVFVTNWEQGRNVTAVDPARPASQRLRKTGSGGAGQRGQPGSRERLYSGQVSPETRQRLDSILMRMNLQSLRIR